MGSTDGLLNRAGKTKDDQAKKVHSHNSCLLNPHLEHKDLIMSNVKHLKDKYNEDGIKYFIGNQMPETEKEQCSQTNELIKEVKEKSQGLPKK